LFSTRLLSKYEVGYYQCTHCGFIQTEKPYWLEEAYGSAISSLDVGLVARNLEFVEVVAPLIVKHFDYKASFLDYAGGYGLFVRMMRDKGFQFYRQDPYCENLFAQHFDYTDLPLGTTFELLTAFEVFEHLADPIPEIGKMFALADSVLFSTVLQPDTPLRSPGDWWYFVPESGQHVAFYNRKALELLAAKFDCRLYTNGQNLHLFTRRTLGTDPFKAPEQRNSVPRKNVLSRSLSKLLRMVDPPAKAPVGDTPAMESLTVKDWEYLKQKLYQ
jgi:hypothetical protein